MSYISGKSSGQFTITHNYAYGTETMNYVILNGDSDKIKRGSCTLDSGTSTVVNDSNVASASKIFLQTTDQNGFFKFARVVSKSNGSFEITHQSASGNETFDYIVFNADGDDDIYLGSDTLDAYPITNTTVIDDNAETGSTILLQSTSAQTWLGSPAYAYWRINGKSNGHFTITSNAIDLGATFDYVILNT